jgi:hypothetical protein
MNCPQVRARLPGLLYGDLAPEDAAAIEAHLVVCGDCRRDRDALHHVRQALDVVPTATAAVDLPRLYRDAAQAQERRLRRWRRAALALGAVAAAVALFAVLPSLEFRCDAHQFVVRWGAPPPVPESAPQPSEPPSRLPEPERTQFVSTTSPDVEEQLRLLNKLVPLLAADADSRDERWRAEFATVRAQMNDLRNQTQQWRLATARDVAAIYAVQFPQGKKGIEP